MSKQVLQNLEYIRQNLTCNYMLHSCEYVDPLQ